MGRAATVDLPIPVRAALHELKERLTQRFGERFCGLRLFGSHAVGTATAQSDVDLLVLIKGLTHAEKIEAVELTADLSIDHFVDLSPLVISPEEFDFLLNREIRLAQDIQRVGVPL